MDYAALLSEAMDEDTSNAESWDARDFIWDPIRGVAIKRDETDGGQNQDIGVAPAHWGGNPSKSLPRGPLLCQVASCGKNLLEEKTYYQRHRICSQHLKMLSLVVDGRPSRFCQQCGKFHELQEFDGDRRSCRSRLAVHNARRRKRDSSDPHGDGQSGDPAAQFQKKGPVITVNLQGASSWQPQANDMKTTVWDNQIMPSTSAADRGLDQGWPMSVNTEDINSAWPPSSRHPWQAQQQSCSNLRGSDQNGFNAHQHQQQNQWGLIPSVRGPTSFISPQDALVLLQMQQRMSQQQAAYAVPSVPSDLTSVTTKQHASDGNSNGGGGNTDGENASGGGLIAESSYPSARLPEDGGPSESYQQNRKNLSSLEVAMALLEGRDDPVPAYTPDDTMVRISLKVANCTPDQLPPDMFCRLRSLLLTADASVLQGFLRPGCTHLVFDICLNGSGRSASELCPELFFRALGARVCDEHDVSVQSDDGSLSLHRADQSKVYTPLPLPDVSSYSSIPRLIFATAATVVGSPLDGSISLYAAGHGLMCPGARVLLRAQGGYLPIEWSHASDMAAHNIRASLSSQSLHRHLSNSDSIDVIKVVVSPKAASSIVSGLAMLEVQAPGVSHVLSNWLPVVFAESEAEVLDLSRASQELRIDYGLLMDYVLTVRRYRCISLHDDEVLPIRSEDELARTLAKARSLLAYCQGSACLNCLSAKLSEAVELLAADLKDATTAVFESVPNGSAYRMSSSLMELSPVDPYNTEEHSTGYDDSKVNDDEDWLPSTLFVRGDSALLSMSSSPCPSVTEETQLISKEQAVSNFVLSYDDEDFSQVSLTAPLGVMPLQHDNAGENSHAKIPGTIMSFSRLSC